MSHSTAYFLVGQSYVYVPPKNTAPQKMFGYLFHFVLATILSTGLTDANKSVYNQLDDSAAFQDEQFLPSGSIFLESSLPDDIILDDTWRYRPFPGIQVPVVRSPYPTFGSPWPLPQFWSSSFCYYNLDSENFNFKLNKISNDILKSAINRYTYIIQNKLGFGIYPKIWQHDDYKLPTYNFKNYQLECRRNAGKSHQYDSNTGKNTYKSNIMRRKNHMPFVSHRPYTSYRQYISGQISRLIKKYKLSSLIMPYTGSQKFALLHVIKSGSSWPHIDMDESYILGVSEDGILIVANETWGALRALETLSQLMWTSGDQSYVFINETYIEDFPRFKHRGLMLDTSRHYMSKSVILLNLEAMSYNKLNVFHWHIVDDQSFPYQSHAFPELSAKGAYREDLVYTSKDISEILEFARFRGIRVIPEFDIPGHTRSVSLSHPEIMSQCSQKTGYFGPLNPALNRTYTFLEKLFNEVFSLFVDEYIHLGGDEVETVCWKSDPHIMQSEQYSTQFSPTFWNNYFWRQVQNLVTRIGNSNPDLRRNLIVWQDVLNHVTEVKKTSLIQVWSTSPTSYLSQGHNIVYSTCWYLDSLNDIKRWTDFYLCDPANDAPINTQQQIFGGEACMWSEYQSDYTVLLRIWPTTSAVAERLWSPRDTVDLVYAGPRIEEQRCRLINKEFLKHAFEEI
uniref:Beta-hexosaminidase n=1 Tax=Trichobilharzia regenti TaxID=157069 RepID=A0AA85KC93_TRIRE|nr:unnamed protein product [Trichobilharzia regenti]